jgi:hypothetical protein
MHGGSVEAKNAVGGGLLVEMRILLPGKISDHKSQISDYKSPATEKSQISDLKSQTT